VNFEEGASGVDGRWFFEIKLSARDVAAAPSVKILSSSKTRKGWTIAMAFGIGSKRSKPQAQQQTQSTPAASAPAPGPAPVPADWAAVLKPAGPKGRFVQGQNAKVGYTQ
jgi:hypothetical protein